MGRPPRRGRPRPGRARSRRELRTLAMPHAAVAVEVGDHADDHPGDACGSCSRPTRVTAAAAEQGGVGWRARPSDAGAAPRVVRRTAGADAQWPHAGVRRGRCRHRRCGRTGGRRRTRRARPDTTRCSSSPTSPRSRRRRCPDLGRRRRCVDGHDLRRRARRSPATNGSTRSPACCRARRAPRRSTTHANSSA